MIKTIIFDLDDTLLWDKKSVETAFQKTCAVAKEVHAIDPIKLEEAVREAARELYASYETYEFTKLIGINPFEGLWGTFDDETDNFQRMRDIVPTYRKKAWELGLNKLGIDDQTFAITLAERFVKEREKHPFVYEETFTILDELRQNYQLILLTNGAPSLQEKKLNITPELRAYFDHIIISGAFGKGKPDPSIFDYAIELAEVEKEEAIMIGDNLMTDILGSNRAGIRNIWINREDKKKTDVNPTYEINHLSKVIHLVKEL
ncbi:Pyrimidine 5'-nucleotidase YjjG [Paraliobacillus sp. PM-2]|uniref:HAD family hydrolase n=1 Tax=Paraliobacillus sp. PM-2 TaxID=1462524 RepID=UPI00061C9D03|nr:HAD family hydrolase [Paraliobacillus sp. PM-2]CQR45827.1 Pyrimidine 5'-nucleotidase YjjG [Paraliobacillus sp. PM-2]